MKNCQTLFVKKGKIMSFNHWMEVYNSSPPESASDDSLNKMAELAVTFDDWRNVYYRASALSGLRTTAFQNMIHIAKTFGNWLFIYYEAGDECEASREGQASHKLYALNMLIMLANNPKDVDWTKNEKAIKLFRWHKIFEICPKNDNEWAARRIIKLMCEKKDDQ